VYQVWQDNGFLAPRETEPARHAQHKQGRWRRDKLLADTAQFRRGIPNQQYKRQKNDDDMRPFGHEGNYTRVEAIR
jgi:hypothetical protein